MSLHFPLQRSSSAAPRTFSSPERRTSSPVPHLQASDRASDHDRHAAAANYHAAMLANLLQQLPDPKQAEAGRVLLAELMTLHGLALSRAVTVAAGPQLAQPERTASVSRVALRTG